MMIDKNLLYNALQNSWDQETARGEWTPNNPSLNQCAVTALVVQDFLGGVILRCPTEEGDSHYWNIAEDGQEIDFTASQFQLISDKPLRENAEIRGREYLLSYPDTQKRHQILLEKIKYWLMV